VSLYSHDAELNRVLIAHARATRICVDEKLRKRLSTDMGEERSAVRTARLFFSRSLESNQGHGAVAKTNSLLASSMAKLGFSIDADCRPDLGISEIDACMPVRSLALRSHIQGSGAAQFAIYDDAGLHFQRPSREIANHNIVFMHGAANAASVWLDPSAAIDLFCTGSDYFARVVHALSTTPTLEPELREPTFWSKTHRIRLPLTDDHATPAQPDAPSPELRRAYQGTAILGHCIQPRKMDLRATTAILVLLNMLQAQQGDGRRIQLVVHQEDFHALRKSLTGSVDRSGQSAELQLALQRLHLRLEDLFVPVPWISQATLFGLMTRSRFGLAFMSVPESFGFYALESILCGCPLYTNGLGNLRHLLPPEHGIDVLETPGMAFGEVGEFAQVAARIHDGVMQATPSADCARGQQYIRQQHNLENFEADLRAALDRAGQRLTPTPLAERNVETGPLVRSYDEPNRRLVSDYRSRVLSPAEADVLVHARDQRLGSLLATLDRPQRRLLQRLFVEGTLSVAQS
jgi:hypothetical protein